MCLNIAIDYQVILPILRDDILSDDAKDINKSAYDQFEESTAPPLKISSRRAKAALYPKSSGNL